MPRQQVDIVRDYHDFWLPPSATDNLNDGMDGMAAGTAIIGPGSPGKLLRLRIEPH